MNRILCVFLYCFVFISANGQQKKTFVLKGSINADTGTMIMLSAVSSGFYGDASVEAEVPVTGGQFRFTGKIPYPVAVLLGLKQNGSWKYLSGMLIIAPETQQVLCNIDSSRLIPQISNQYTAELRLLSKKIRELDTGKLGFLHSYIKKHPDSYPAAWTLASISNQLYSDRLDSCLMRFSPAFRNSQFGRQLNKQVSILRNTTIGGTFPEVQVRDEQNNNVHLARPKLSSARLTLIDFWFNACVPCIQQFPSLQDLYRNYKGKGFEIFAISTDRNEFADQWRSAIKKYQLAWPQYRDPEGLVAEKLGVSAFPYNYLVDANGKILAKDISMEELAKILKANLAEPK